MDPQTNEALWGAIETLRTDLATNTADTKEVKSDVKAIKESTADLVSMFEAWKGAMKVLGWLASLAKWVGAIGAGFGGVYGAWTAFKYGLFPSEISPK